MRDMLKMGLTLMIICVIAAASLAQVYKVTKVKIDRNMADLEARKRKDVLPQAVAFEEKVVDGRKVFVGKDVGGSVAGLVFGVTPRGYGGPINILLGLDTKGAVTAVSITKLDQTETPGLGTKVTEPRYRDQFKGKEGEALKLRKDGGSIDAITAATISSRAVANGIYEGVEWYKKAAGVKQ